MTVRVKLFAVAKELVGRDEVELQLPAEATVAHVRAALGEHFPALADVVRYVQFAVNAEYAGDQATVPANAEVACIPPVSGG